MLRRSILSVSGPTLALLLTLPGCYSGLTGTPEPGADGGPGGEAGDEEGEDEGGSSGGDDSGSADDGDSADDGEDDGPEPAPFDPADPESQARKVKLLLTGEPVLEAELVAIRTNPNALRALVSNWTHTEGFHSKMLEFFKVSFHQEDVTKANIVSQIRAADATGSFDPRPELYRNLTESFARTAWTIVEEGRPFTEVATTRRWQMTTAMMSFLVAVDDDPTKGPNHTFYHNSPPAGMGPGSSVAQQVANRAWYIPNGCVDPSFTTNKHFFVLPALMGRLTTGGTDCPDFDADAVFQNADFEDWRTVELTTLGAGENKTPYYDVPTLRNASTLALSVPRTGYFSTPAFLAKWRSNVDNSFRVTTNQALIVGLGQSFDDEDATMPLDESGLSEDHAADPASQCYACHKNLDPMRNFFAKEFDPDWYSALDEKADVTASFSFFGEVSEGSDLTDLGLAIASHPFFAGAWVQKLCYMANSQECNPDDPEFQRVRDNFVAGGFDFRALVVDLFSSPLVTGARRTLTHDTHEYLVSITRKAHLCHTLETRLSWTGLCAGNNNVANAAPEDAWSRGSGTPFQPASSSLFYAATMDAFCDKVGKVVVDEPDSPLQSADMEGSITFLVEGLMDLNPADSRHAMARAAIEQHIEDAAMVTQNARIQLESAFTLACTSPFITAVGY